MYPIKLLNNLLFMENLLGIYRNYYSQKKIKKCFIIFQIFVQTVFHTGIMLIGAQHWWSGQNTSTLAKGILNFGGFSTTAYMSSVSSVVTGICYSYAFISCLESIRRISERFKNDKKFINSSKKTYWISVTVILMWIPLGIFKCTQIQKTLPHDMGLAKLIPVLVSQIIIKMTVVFQHLMFFIVIMTVVNLMKCLNSLISAVQNSVEICHNSLYEECDITSEQIHGWVELYRDLANCCEKVSLSFGGQFFFLLVLAITTHILMLYQICYTSILNTPEREGFIQILLIRFSYTSLSILPIVTGQLIHNQGIKIYRLLARLYTKMIIDSDEAEAKLVKDFIRLTKKNPLQIKLLSKLPTGTYLLPVMLSLTLNNTIVMLQFNHVI